MSPITHFLVGWTLLEQRATCRRDKALVVCAGLLPDLDGAGLAIDMFNRFRGLPETSFYQETHRLYGHGLFSALLIAMLAGALARRRGNVIILSLVCVHLHYLCDMLGSRGSTPEDLWGIHYLAPFWPGCEWVWSGQWPLVSWQNMLISVILMGMTLWRATCTGYSPLHLISPQADGRFVAILRHWWQQRGP